MSKYFIKGKEQEFKLSEYIKSVDDREKMYLEYAMQQMGDITLSKDKIEYLYMFLRMTGGKYDVRLKPETLKGLREIIEMYPDLSGRAIEMIGSSYIKDLFEKYSLTLLLDKFIRMFGKTDDAFEMYLACVNLKADELQNFYTEEADKLKEYEEEYGKSFIEYFMSVIKRKHITLEQIEKSLPSSDLIKEDEQLISDISKRTRIYMGACYPISYSMVEMYAEGKDLSSCPEQPVYTINTGISDIQEIPTKFTKVELIESIKVNKTKKLK